MGLSDILKYDRCIEIVIKTIKIMGDFAITIY